MLFQLGTILQIAHRGFEDSDILTILIKNGVNPNEKDKEVKYKVQ